MKKKVILIFAVSCFLLQTAIAQQHPWEKYGYKPRVQTLSNGKYEEFHDMDTIVQIGSVIFDRYNGKIIGKAKPDTILGEPEMKPYIVSRWMSPDPLSEEYTGWSPYNYTMNNPIRFIDPDGRWVGDYYKNDGTYLGSDGIQDDIAYTASSVTKNSDGNVVDAQDKNQLSISNSTLGKFANAIANESSGNSNESFALASSIVNLSSYKGKDILSTLKSEGIFGYNGNTDFSNSKNSLGAAINALTGGSDYSNGAIRWDGFDLAAKGFSHIKATSAGLYIGEEHFNSFKAAWPDSKINAFSGGKYTSFSSNFSAGIHRATDGANKGMSLYNSTAVVGSTIFWGKNSKNFNYMYQIVWPSGTTSNLYPAIFPNKNFKGSW